MIDLPHLPAKTVGPDEAYVGAGEAYRKWLSDGVLERRTVLSADGVRAWR